MKDSLDLPFHVDFSVWTDSRRLRFVVYFWIHHDLMSKTIYLSVVSEIMNLTVYFFSHGLLTAMVDFKFSPTNGKLTINQMYVSNQFLLRDGPTWSANRVLLASNIYWTFRWLHLRAHLGWIFSSSILHHALLCDRSWWWDYCHIDIVDVFVTIVLGRLRNDGVESIWGVAVST